jgi:hypothetical protein
MNKQRGISTTLSILLVVLLITIIGGGVVYKYYLAPGEEPSDGKQGESQDETADWNTYRNETNGSEFEYPNQWELVEDNFIKDSRHSYVTRWGNPDDWCIGLNTGINIEQGEENKDLVVYLLISDASIYQEQCDQKGENLCSYDKENPIFSNNEIKVYKPNTGAYPWLIEGRDIFMGIDFNRNILSGFAIPDYLGEELRQDLKKLNLKILSTFRFLE